MIVTDDERLAGLCRSMRNQGRAVMGGDVGSWLAHERLGYNYRLSNVLAGIGLGQMEVLDERIAQRRAGSVGDHQIHRARIRVCERLLHRLRKGAPFDG